MKNILEYLERSAVLYPDKTAVDDGSDVLDYTELKELSMRIGSAVIDALSGEAADAVFEGEKKRERENGTRQYPIVIFSEKSVYALASMLGVVYSGNFYVNVSTEQPKHRLRSIFEVLRPAAVIVNRADKAMLESYGYDGRILVIEECAVHDIDKESLRRVREGSGSGDLLYCVFTSGSTGRPKGIMTSHLSVMKVIDCFVDIFKISSEDRFANQAPFDFDVSVKDIYASLAAGATMVIVPKKLFATVGVLMDYLEEKKVTALIWAVSALCLVSSMKGLRYKAPDSINKVMFSGEVMPLKELKKWQDAFPGAMFVNLYGPSEITCHCTYHIVEKYAADIERIPIGTAFPGRSVFLVDEEGTRIDAANETGEIMVAGDSLSEGYYNEPRLTDESFTEYKVDGVNLERAYKTGDIGYYGEDGKLHFSGRKDFQIKNMGHRVELEEIEAAINALDGVERCCCVFDSGRKKLKGYYTGSIDKTALRVAVKRSLPEYMIPRELIRVDEIPLSKNGKLDREYFRSL